MDLTTLNLSPEQTLELEGHITGITQSETDKVRTEYTKKSKLIEDELVKYKPVDKSESEIALDTRLKALEDKEKEVLGKEKMLDINSKLTEQGLPSQFSKYLLNSEDVETEITSLKEMFNNSTLNGGFKPTDHKANSITKEQFKGMSYSERATLSTKNPELYKQLAK